MTGHHIKLGDAQNVLQPRIADFAKALKTAIQTWNHPFGAYHHILDEFARGVVIGQLWYAESAQALTSDPGVRLKKNGERAYFILDGAVALRFKHLDSEYRPRNSLTDRGRAWSHQMNFPGIPRVPRLDFGYRMDLTGTVAETAFVMLNSGDDSRWRWQIWGHPVTAFAGASTNMYGDTVYAHDDYSKVV